MARVVVLPDAADLRSGIPHEAALIEEVVPEHFDDRESSLQILERIVWATCEASGVPPREHGAAMALSSSSIEGVRREMRTRPSR